MTDSVIHVALMQQQNAEQREGHRI